MSVSLPHTRLLVPPASRQTVPWMPYGPLSLKPKSTVIEQLAQLVPPTVVTMPLVLITTVVLPLAVPSGSPEGSHAAWRRGRHGPGSWAAVADQVAQLIVAVVVGAGGQGRPRPGGPHRRRRVACRHGCHGHAADARLAGILHAIPILVEPDEVAKMRQASVRSRCPCTLCRNHMVAVVWPSQPVMSRDAGHGTPSASGSPVRVGLPPIAPTLTR